jgi:exopolysaccharide biosynthesis predicted pyruvyltransferase EpsI
MKELDLETYLRKYKDAGVDFFRFPGNYGDSLIWHGTKILLSALNISEHYVDFSSPKYHDVLFIDGGGNFVDYYSDVRRFLIKKPALYHEIIILPHTIFGEMQIEVLNNISSNLTVFCS